MILDFGHNQFEGVVAGVVRAWMHVYCHKFLNRV